MMPRSKRITGGRLVRGFLAGLGRQTQRGYRSDLWALARFLRMSSIEDTSRFLLGCSQGKMNALAFDYRSDLLRRGLSPATINRRLAVLRSLLRHARLLGLVSWAIDVVNVPRQGYRNTQGPRRDGVIALFQTLQRSSDTMKLRDFALLRLLYDLALRRNEIVSLDRKHVDLEQGLIWVLGKGRHQRTRLSLPDQTRDALAQWITHRGDDDGALFTNADRARKGRRLTGRSLYRIVRRRARCAGLQITPHGLRHAAITAALDSTGGDVRAVQRFSRHRDLRVLNVYDDNRQDLAGHVARLVAATTVP